jgi:hypothetical protein
LTARNERRGCPGDDGDDALDRAAEAGRHAAVEEQGGDVAGGDGLVAAVDEAALMREGELRRLGDGAGEEGRGWACEPRSLRAELAAREGAAEIGEEPRVVGDGAGGRRHCAMIVEVSTGATAVDRARSEGVDPAASMRHWWRFTA